MTLHPSPVGVELLDDPAADPEAVRLSLGNIARANRWFGGAAAVRYGLARVLDPAPERAVTLLDVGTGAGDLPAMAHGWATRRGIALTPLALERSPPAASLAHERGVPTVVGCGGALPFPDGAVDVVVLSQVIHHVDTAGRVLLLREAARVARVGGVVADLHPSGPAALGFRVAGRLMGFDHYTLVDGVTSLRRGLSVDALSRLLAQAGLIGTVRRRPGSRIVAWWRTVP